MTRPYSYRVSFINGAMGPTGSLITPYLEVKDNEYDHDLLLHQRAPWPEGEEGERSRATLHRLIDAWLDGVEFEV
jgi:hypothetical protein